MNRSLLTSVALYAATVSAGCSQLSPVSPAASTAGTASARLAVGSAGAVAFDLIEGTFSIVGARGDAITGTYSGVATFSDAGIEQSSLTLQVADGSGSFQGARGTLQVTGRGAFADEGGFSLDAKGPVSLAGGRRANVVLNLRGTSVAACATSERIALALTGSGTMVQTGRVTATFSHEVVGSGCSS